MKKAKKKKRKSWRSEEEEVRLTWCVALPLYLGTEGDRARGAEPAAQSLLLRPSLRGLFTHKHLLQHKHHLHSCPLKGAAPHFREIHFITFLLGDGEEDTQQPVSLA